jgi:ADP-heptose:LPS heptosyltransferase
MFILTVRNDRLGDLILALPTLAALRRQFPDARLGIVVAPATSALFDLYPDSIDVWPDGEESRGRLRSDRPDAMLFLFPDRQWAKAAHRARVPERIGTLYRLHAWQFNRRVKVHRRHRGRHEALCNLRTAEPLIGTPQLVPPCLAVSQATRTDAGRLLSERGLAPEGPYVVVHPGSRGSAWHWPESHYTEVTEELSQAGIRVVVTGSDTEADLCRRVAGRAAVSLAGRTDLPLLGAVLSQARLVVVGSTGPMHLAAALGTPVVALFSPRPSHAPDRWGPLGDGHTVLLPAPGPEQDPAAAMASIAPARVAATVLARLGRKEPAA